MADVSQTAKRILGRIPGLGGSQLEQSLGPNLGWRRVATMAAGLLALGMGYHVIFGQNGLTAYEQKRREYQELDQQLHSLQHENELLKSHVDRLQSDPDAIEHQAREELHYARPGEVIYTMPAVPSAASATSPKK